jgi:aspartyl protease family protein
MRAVIAFALVGAAALALALTPADTTLLGLTEGQFARLAYGGAIAFVLTGSLLWRYQGRLGEAVSDFLFWVALLAVLVTVYSYRFELVALGGRVIGQLIPGATIEGPGGEVVVTRRIDGNFVVRMNINGTDLPFVFDTGASSVVVRAEDARKIGLDVRDPDYSIPISTANGSAMAADAAIDRLAVGHIALRHVPALVTKVGTLRENLLGMSFLEKLESFTVSGDRLVLKGRRQ